MPTLVNSFQSIGGATAPDTFILLPKPVGVAVNHLLLLIVNLSVDATPVPPGDFILIAGAAVAGAPSTRIYQKRATASEPNEYQIEIPAGAIMSAAIMAVAPSTLTYPVVHQVATSTSAVASSNKVWTGVTNSVANTLLLCFGCFAVGGASTPDAAMTERIDGSSASTRLYMMSQAVVATGATGTRTATGTSATQIRTVTLSIADSATETIVRPTPHWGELGPGGLVTTAGWEYSKTLLVSGVVGGGTIDSGQYYAMPLPPTDAVRMRVEGVWTETRVRTGNSGTVPAYTGEIVSTANVNGIQNLSGLPKATGAVTNGATLSVSFVATFTRNGGETDWELSYADYVATPPAAPTGYARFRLNAQLLMGAVGNYTATETLTFDARITEIELEGAVVFLAPKVLMTEVPVIAEIWSQGIEVTEVPVIIEMSRVGLYVTEVPVIAEMGAVGLYMTSAPVIVEIEYVRPEVIMPTYFPENAGTRKIHRLLPDEVTGYAFDPEHSWWSTIKAEQSSNLIRNPSFEGWDADGDCVEYTQGGFIGSIEYVEFSPVGATAGRRCAKVTSGAASGELIYPNAPVTPGPYTWSFGLYVTQAPATIVMWIWNGSGDAARRTFTVWESGWQRHSITYIELGSGVRELRLLLPSAGVTYPIPAGRVFYTDAWQFEAKGYPTTYLDGDMVGFADSSPSQSYFWQGAPHHSPSTRRETTGSGGRVVSWSQEAKFKTTSIIGLGMTGVDQKTQTLGDGREVHLGMTDKSRDFTITGRVFASNHRHLMQRHNDLINLLKPNNTLGGDQAILRFQEVDDAENLVGAALDIICVYKEGLQGNITGLYQENLPLQFRAVQPYLMDIIESSAELALNKVLVDNGIIYRDEMGEYMNLGTGITLGGVASRVGFLRDGHIVALGNYTQLNGDVVVSAALWDDGHWYQLGTGGPSGATDIDDGYRLGYPLTASTVGGNVVEYDETTGVWTTLGGHGFIGPINSLYRDTFGDIWVGGKFVFADDGVSVYNNVAHWVAATNTWEPLGEGLTDPDNFIPGAERVNSVLATNDGFVYFAGNFGRGVSDAATALAGGAIRWEIATESFRAMGSGFNLAPNALLRGQDGYIYATGPFGMDSPEHFNLRGFARYNGVLWEEIFPLVRQDGSFGADGMTQDNEGIFWFYNYTGNTSTDLFVVEGLGEVATFGYRDGVFYPPFMADAGAYDMVIGPGDRLIVASHGISIGETTTVPALNYIDYAGGADAPLVVHLSGPGQFLSMVSLSTRGGVYGRDTFVMSENEEVMLRTDTQRQMAYSNQRFNLQTQLAAGASNFKALRLRPGSNRISLLITGIDADLSLGWLSWKNRFWGLQEAPR